MAGTRLTMQPGELCVRAGETRSAVVVFSPTAADVASCFHQVAVLASVALFHGDEITRQKYRK